MARPCRGQEKDTQIDPVVRMRRWLTDHVPPDYLGIPEEAAPRGNA